jgi:hypothetical protein
MCKRLCDVAEVLTGYPFRGKVMVEDGGDLVAFQIKDLTGQGGLDLAGALRIRGEANFHRHLLRANDILMQSRGTANRAVIFEGTVNAIAALGLLIIRPNVDVVRPAFLLWYLNHPKTQDRLRDLARGSTVAFVAKTDVAEFTVPTPPLAVQEQIIVVDQLRRKERAQAAELDQICAKYIDTLTWHAAVSDSLKKA